MQRVDPYASLASNHAAFPRFGEDQRKAAEEVYDALVPHIRKGSIEVIVDLGCGGGETLVRIAQLLDADERTRALRPKPLLLIGLDSSPELVEHAQKSLQAATLERVRCVFEVCEAEATPFDQLAGILRANGRRAELCLQAAAIVCLGHTIFHFPYLTTLFDELATNPANRPHLWLIDIYHSWDNALANLDQSPDGQVLEPRSFADGTRSLNVLFTRRSERRGFVDRGLLQTSACAFDDAVEAIRTQQLHWTSSELIDQFADAQYVVAQRYRGISGYGEMERLTLFQASRTFSLPALILDCKLVPRLPLERQSSGGHEASPLTIISEWIADAGMLNGEKGNSFDFIIVEAAPHYSSDRGMSFLKQEVTVCCQPAFAESAANWLKAYRDTLHKALLCNLTPYFHPSFAGYGGGEDWPPVHFSLLQGGRADIECTSSESAHFNRWGYAFDERADAEAKEPAEGPTALENTNAHILVERNNQSSLAGSLPEQKRGVERRLLQAYGADTLRQLDKATLARDLHLVQQCLHDRLRQAFETQPGATTIFVGMPLRSRYDEFRGSIDRLDGLPERYRGGIWIFARTQSRYEYAQHALMGDLARLSLHLQGTAIDAQAADELYTSTLGQYMKLYQQPGMSNAGACWRENDSAAGIVFPPGSFHHRLAQWRRLLQDGNAPAKELALARKAAARVLASCGDAQPDRLSDIQCIAFLKALLKNGISVSFLREMLVSYGFSGVESQSSEKTPPRHRRRDNEDMLVIADGFKTNGGHVLYAIHSLCHSPPENEQGEEVGRVIAADIELDRDRSEYLLRVDVEFDTDEACNDAAEALSAQIKDAGNLAGKEATSACIVLRNVAVRREDEPDTAWAVTFEPERRLRLKFWFAYKGIR